MRDLTGRSLHDREAGFASDTRTLAESESERDRRGERAGPYALAVAVLFVVFVILMIALR